MNERQAIDLNGLWRFSPDPHRDGESLGFYKSDRAFPRWRETIVPSCFEAACPDIDFYEGVGWYRRSFELPAPWVGRRIVLHFEGVNYRSKVWLNGACLGEHRDGFLPFSFEIGALARWDGPNLLALAVDNAHHEGDVPGMHTGWRGYGGILRDVWLEATAPVWLENPRITAEPGVGNGAFRLRVRARNAGTTGGKAVVVTTIRDGSGAARTAFKSEPASLDSGAVVELEVAGLVPDVHAWSPASPMLYQAEIGLSLDGRPVDSWNEPFGFRTIETTPEGLRLNGEPLFLTGFNRHEDSPRTAMAVDRETTRQDLEKMKEAGANFIRLCHYPHDPAELTLCDQLGLLVLCEIPLYFWNDAGEGCRTQAARAESAARQLDAMIERDINHPSVILWSVSNETNEEVAEVAEDNRALIRRARSLDPSRLCVHVKNNWDIQPYFEEDDVICVNAYPAMDFARCGHHPAEFDLAGAVARHRERLDALHRLFPSKPILITEFGYSSFAGTFGQSFGEDEHARSIEAEFAVYDAPYVCGAVIWCWADHPWPAGRFFNGLTMSPFGVVTRARERKAPFWTVRALFRARQGLPGLPSTHVPSGTSVRMIRSHLRDLPVVPFPAGFGIRPMAVDDIGLWTDIQRDAEPYVTITDTLFRREFGSDLEAVARRCYIVTGPKGLGVGTISAWHDRDFLGREYGRIHWVSVRPGCQGKGVGKAALAYAMGRLAEWHDCAYLVTSTERIAAIALYLSFGFEPDMTPANARVAWEGLNKKLPHPVVKKALGETPG